MWRIMMLGVIVFPLVYAFVFASCSPGSTTVHGVVFGVVLWLMMEAAVMPMLARASFGMNAPGMTGVVAALMAHLVYGVILGFVAAACTTAAELQVA